MVAGHTLLHRIWDQRDIGSNLEFLSKETSSHVTPLHSDAKRDTGEETKSMRLGGIVRRM